MTTRLTVEERNALARKYVCDKISIAHKRDISYFTSCKDDSLLNQLVIDLICVKANGFRGVVLTAIVGLYLDSNYNPLDKFYDCNPRSIFENGIWYALNENKIPSGKSDPLNVAKNINELNESWAEGRRPQKSAMAAVLFLRKLVQEEIESRKEELIDYFFFNLVNYAKSIESIRIVSADNVAVSNQVTAVKLIRFILEYPESGSMPQLLVGCLLKELLESDECKVYGDTESVFGTNTTSKKPADLWVETSGEVINLYEITVKKVDYKRLDDCLDSLLKLNYIDRQITFICRIPVDIEGLELTDELTIDYKGKLIDFVDIRSFVSITSSLLSSDKLNNVLNKMQLAIEDVNRPINTKNGWNSIFAP